MNTRSCLRVATAQSQVSSDVLNNGAEIYHLMMQAREAGADLIHFPELALSGYGKTRQESWEIVDWSRLREVLSKLAEHAKALGLWVILGANHPLSSPHLPHNSLYILSDQGELVDRYDKQYCSNSELNGMYTPGRYPLVFEVKGWKLGCSICIEIQFPELFMKYAQLDIDCMFYSAYSDSPMFRIQAQAYAASYNMWFSFSIPTQCSQKVSSAMIGPDGYLINQCKSLTSGFTLTILDKEDSNWHMPLRLAKPWRQKARMGEIYQRQYVDDPRSEHKKGF